MNLAHIDLTKFPPIDPLHSIWDGNDPRITEVVALAFKEAEVEAKRYGIDMREQEFESLPCPGEPGHFWIRAVPRKKRQAHAHAHATGSVEDGHLTLTIVPGDKSECDACHRTAMEHALLERRRLLLARERWFRGGYTTGKTYTIANDFPVSPAWWNGPHAPPTT